MYGDFLAQNWTEHSWTEVLQKGEALGGPSPMGSSKYDTFKRCPYLYNLLFIRRWTPKEYNEALEVGGLFHEALARYFQGWLDGGTLNEIRVNAFEIINRAADVVPNISSEVHRLFTSWLNMYHDTAYSFLERVIAVEFLVSTFAGFKYSARLDLVLEAEDGGIEIMDHKTARQYTANLLLSHRMEPQFLGHMFLWSSSGMGERWGELTKYTVDLLTKTAMPTIELVNVPIRPQLLEDWRREMIETWKLFQRYKISNIWPRRTGYQCRFCEAFEHCANDAHSLAEWRRKRKDEF